MWGLNTGELGSVERDCSGRISTMPGSKLQ